MTDGSTLRRRALAVYGRIYTVTSMITAVLFGSFEAMFGWGPGALGAAVPVVIASNRAAEVFSHHPTHKPDIADTWWLAGEMAAVSVAITVVLTVGIALPLAVATETLPALQATVEMLAPGALIASATGFAALALMLIRVILPLQVDAARRR
ncbi:MAG: hypothetical protein AAFV86_05150 [Pseudomonadota bacterium]